MKILNSLKYLMKTFDSLGLVWQAGLERFYRVIYRVNTMLHAKTLHAPFGTLVLARPSPSIHYHMLKYTPRRRGLETP
jgi:hypothetical protein